MRPGKIFLHQRQADPLGDASFDLAFEQRRVYRPANVMCGRDLQQAHYSQFEVDFQFG